MEGNKSVIRLKSGPPLEVSNFTEKVADSKTGIFSVKRSITYTVGKRHVSLTINEIGCAGRVNVVYLDLSEKNGKGSSAILNLQVIRNERYGVLCRINTKLAGTYDSFKENYCMPPSPDTTFLCYVCRETGSGGCFTLEKKKDNNEIVEKVKATYAFIIEDDISYNVKVKITTDKRVGLSVEVEGPMKLTMDYTKQLISRIRGKMESQMEANMFYLFRNAIDGGDRKGYNMNVRFEPEDPNYVD